MHWNTLIKPTDNLLEVQLNTSLITKCSQQFLFPGKLFFAFSLTSKVSGLVQSTQSLLLEEQECLTGAKGAQGSIIDLTSQSCRALSPSFTLPACQPHTSALTYRETQPRSRMCKHCTGTFNESRYAFAFSSPCLVLYMHARTHTHNFSSLEKLNGVKLSVGPSVSWVFGRDRIDNEE